MMCTLTLEDQVEGPDNDALDRLIRLKKYTQGKRLPRPNLGPIDETIVFVHHERTLVEKILGKPEEISVKVVRRSVIGTRADAVLTEIEPRPEAL